ncbi:methyltransferase family protein [Rhizobium binxianense]
MQATTEHLGRKATGATAKFVLFLAVLIFLAAGTPAYWQGWLFLANFCGWSAATTAYFLKRDPALVERRLHAGPAAEREPAQKRIQLFMSVVMIALFIGSVLDWRFGWSVVPVPAVILGNGLVALGFAAFFLVMRENSFASATIEVRQGQHVVSSGPYALVRHPMYAGALLMFAGMPPALGSWWGLAGMVPIAAGLAARLLDEEKHLARDLPGYDDYRRKVRYRLVPGLW